MDLCQSSNSIFTYAKLGRFIILGFVYEPNLARWKGTKVNAQDGLIEPRTYVVPKAFGTYLNEKANAVHTSLGGISERQREKIDTAFRSNLDNYAASDAFKAMNADVEMFGTKAFSVKNRTKE